MSHNPRPMKDWRESDLRAHFHDMELTLLKRQIKSMRTRHFDARVQRIANAVLSERLEAAARRKVRHAPLSYPKPTSRKGGPLIRRMRDRTTGFLDRFVAELSVSVQPTAKQREKLQAAKRVLAERRNLRAAVA